MRQFFVFAIFVISLSACRDKVMCPAYQSAYILDDSVRNTYYSYLWKLDETSRQNYLAKKNQPSSPSATIVQTTSAINSNSDTLGLTSPLDTGVMVASNTSTATDYFAYVQPYVVETRDVNKTKNGIIKDQPYWLKNYRLRTAPKENVLAPIPPEPEAPIETGEFIASDFADSIGDDSSDIELIADSVMLANAYSEEDSFEIPKLAQVAPPKPKTETKFLYRYDPNDKMLNVEQEYYNRHFGHLLYAKVPVKNAEEPSKTTETDSIASEGRFKGFIQNLFKGGGKDKNNLVSEEDEELNEELPPIEEPVNEGEVVEEEDDGF